MELLTELYLEILNPLAISASLSPLSRPVIVWNVRKKVNSFFHSVIYLLSYGRLSKRLNHSASSLLYPTQICHEAGLIGQDMFSIEC